MSDQITMTELGNRWGITRQGAAKLARTNPTFPATTKQGRTVTVDWQEAQRWRLDYERAEAARQMQTWDRDRLAFLRGQLYRHAQRLDGIYAAHHIQKAVSVESCYDLAAKWRLTLQDFTVRPDGTPAD